MTRAATARAPRPAPQADLFGTRLLPGLAYGDDVVTLAEEAELIARIAASSLTPFQFQQWEGKRLTRSFGWTYDSRPADLPPAIHCRAGSNRCALAPEPSPASMRARSNKP